MQAASLPFRGGCRAKRGGWGLTNLAAWGADPTRPRYLRIGRSENRFALFGPMQSAATLP